MDKPFKVGDYITVSNHSGTVEDITFRSTKIRTVENSIVQIPNSIISSVEIENSSEIKKRRYNLNLELMINTKTKKIEILKNEILSILNQNENIIRDSINVHFTDVVGNRLNLSTVFYFNTADYTEFLDLKEEVNKSILDLIDRSNISLANNLQAIEIKK